MKFNEIKVGKQYYKLYDDRVLIYTANEIGKPPEGTSLASKCIMFGLVIIHRNKTGRSGFEQYPKVLSPSKFARQGKNMFPLDKVDGTDYMDIIEVVFG